MKVDVAVSEERCLTAGSFLGFDGGLLAHSSENNDVGILLFFGEEFGNFLANLSIRKLNIILGFTIVSHQGKEAIIGDIKELVFLAGDVGDIHVVGGRAKFLKFLASENINSNEMDLGMSVLASLRSRHVDDLARAALDDDEAVLSQSRALHRKGGRGTGIGRLESVRFMLGIGVRHVY